jgi:hypothetical protein
LTFFTTNHDICTIVQIAETRQQETIVTRRQKGWKSNGLRARVALPRHFRSGHQNLAIILNVSCFSRGRVVYTSAPGFRYDGLSFRQMPPRIRQIAALALVVLQASGLAGCGTINERLSAGVSDAIPAWAGGMPADAPPRPGTAKYDEYMRERERRRLMPAAERDAPPAGTDAKTEQEQEQTR